MVLKLLKLPVALKETLAVTVIVAGSRVTYLVASNCVTVTVSGRHAKDPNNICFSIALTTVAVASPALLLKVIVWKTVEVSVEVISSAKDSCTAALTASAVTVSSIVIVEYTVTVVVDVLSPVTVVVAVGSTSVVSGDNVVTTADTSLLVRVVNDVLTSLFSKVMMTVLTISLVMVWKTVLTSLGTGCKVVVPFRYCAEATETPSGYKILFNLISKSQCCMEGFTIF